MQRHRFMLLACTVFIAFATQPGFARSGASQTTPAATQGTVDSARAAAVANNVLRSFKPGHRQNKAIDRIDTIAADTQPAGYANLDLTVTKRDIVSWIYLDTTCTIIKLLFNDTLDAGRYRFFLNRKIVSRYFYDSDMASSMPPVCWQVLRVGDKRTIEKTMVLR